MWETMPYQLLTAPSLVQLASLSGNHALVESGDGRVWDPSYGTGPFRNLAEWAAHLEVHPGFAP